MKLSRKISNIVSQNFNSFIDGTRIATHNLLLVAYSISLGKDLATLNADEIESRYPGYRHIMNINFEDINSKKTTALKVYIQSHFKSIYTPVDKKSNEFIKLENESNLKAGTSLAHKSKIILSNLGLLSIFSILLGTPSFIIFRAISLAYHTAKTLLQIPATVITHPFSKNSQVTERKEGKVTPLSSNNAKPSVEINSLFKRGKTTPIIHSRSPSTSSLQHSQMERNNTTGLSSLKPSR